MLYHLNSNLDKKSAQKNFQEFENITSTGAINYIKIRMLTQISNMNKLKTIQNKQMLGKIRTMQLTRQQYVLLQNLLTIQLWENRKKQNSLENKSELGIEENRLLYIYKKLESTIKEINKEMPTYKYIREIIFTQEELIKTTTQKVKRHEELKKILQK